MALTGVIGHRQVTHHARLATLDQGLAALHLDVADLLSTSGSEG